MTVRAKFKVDKIVRTMGSRRVTDENGRDKWVPREVHTVVLTPVYGNGDPEHENSKFWAATPSGGIELGCADAETVKEFDLENEFYVDFTKAE